MKRRMKITFFTMSLDKGGAERVITNLCNQYLVQENTVTIITCLNTAPQYPLDPRIKHICIDKWEKQKNQNKIKRFLRRRRRLKDIFNVLETDILVNILPEPSFLALSLKRECRFPMIVSVRSDPVVEYNFLPYKIMMKTLYPRADGFIFQTEDAKNYFSKKIQKKSVIIPNPINKEAIRTSYNGNRKKEIVAVGRLIKEKNYPLLLQVYKSILKDFPDYKLLIYGEGRLKKELENYARGLGLKEQVLFLGQVDNVFDAIYKSRVFIMTSSHEGMPNALMEAMALGLPVIAIDCPCGGPRFLIKNNENGVLVKNKKELEEAVIRVLSDDAFSSKIGKNANLIANDLEPDQIFLRWFRYMLKVKKQAEK